MLCIFIKPNVWYSWSLKILAIKRWLPFNFINILQGCHFVVGRPKIQTFSRHFFWALPSKYYIVKFTAIFVCFLLSWSERYSRKWSSNFEVANSKCQQFLFWKRSRQKQHRLFIFFKGCYFVMGSPIDMNVGVLWETSMGFLKSVVLQLFPKYNQSYVNLNIKSKAKFNCL